MIVEFGSPWILLALPLLLGILFWLRHQRERLALRFSRAHAARDLETTWRLRTRWLLPAVYLCAIALLLLALARPRAGSIERSSQFEGVAIQLVLDRSGSMDHNDFRMQDTSVSRLEGATAIARRFVLGGDALPGRPSDLIGLIAFAASPEDICPLTLDHEFLAARLAEVKPVSNFREDRTAIGDALGLAVAKLAEEKGAGDATMHSRIAILLSDGENNAGQLMPTEAAQLARTLGIRVYTIALGPEADLLGAQQREGAPTEAQRDSRQDQADQVLRDVARLTSGAFYHATDERSLQQVYREIDRLEKSRLARPYTAYRELAIDGFRLGPFALPPLVLLALLLLSFEATLAATTHLRTP